MAREVNTSINHLPPNPNTLHLLSLLSLPCNFLGFRKTNLIFTLMEFLGRRAANYTLLNQFPDDDHFAGDDQTRSNRISSIFSSAGLQSSSTGSDSHKYCPTPSTGAIGGVVRETTSFRSWAQQTEESYQLQLALALRISSEATCADDPNLLGPDERSGSEAVKDVSHRFWGFHNIIVALSLQCR